MDGSGLVREFPTLKDHPSQWTPGWRLVDWQGELVETCLGPAVGAGVYRYDARTQQATRITREAGLIHLEGYYTKLHSVALYLVAEIAALWNRFSRTASEDARLRILLQGLAVEAQLSIVRELYEQPGILCLGDPHEALRTAGFDEAMQLVADGTVPPPSGYPFHEYLTQTHPVHA